MNSEGTAGKSVLLGCEPPKSLPEAIVWWEKDDAEINVDGSHYALDNKSLIINNITLADNGKYVCVAKNTAGVKRSSPAQLNIYGKD